MRAMEAAVNAVSVAAPSATLMPSTASVAKYVTVERFRRRPGKERQAQRARDPDLVPATLGGHPAVAIPASPVARNMKSSSSALPGPVSQAINVSPSM